MKTRTLPLIALTLAVVGCAPQVGPKDGTASPAEVTTDVVKRQDLTGYSFFDAKLMIPPSAQAIAFSPYDTPVVSVSTSVGKYVEKGEPIIKLTIPGADAATAVAKADANSANANYSTEKAANSTPVTQAQKAVDDAKAAEKAAQDTVASGGSADVAAATQARVDAESALAAAKQQLRQSLQPTKEAADQAAAALDVVKADARKGIVRAPISGVVVTLEAQPGMAAQAQQKLATIVDYRAARVQGMVPAELKDLVVKDADVLISVATPNSTPLEGKVLSVTVAPPTAGQKSPGYLAVIEFKKPRSITQPTLAVNRAGVKTGTVHNVLVVPTGSLTIKDGKSFVSVKNGDNWVDTQVETGISDGALVEIKSGISEGAVVRVVTSMQDHHQ